MSLNDQPEKLEIGTVIPLIRLGQVFGTLGLTGMAVVIPLPVPLKILSFGVMVALSVRIGHPFARIVADGRGLYVTRYVMTHFLEWADVVSVQPAWREGGIRIEFPRPIAGLRYAIVPMGNMLNMPVSRAFSVLIRKEEPEAVLWIRERIQLARPRAL